MRSVSIQVCTHLTLPSHCQHSRPMLTERRLFAYQSTVVRPACVALCFRLLSLSCLPLPALVSCTLLLLGRRQIELEQPEVRSAIPTTQTAERTE